MSNRVLIPVGMLVAAVSAGAYAQTAATPSPYKPGEIVTIDTSGNQVLIVSCGLKNGVQQCGVRQGRNGEFGNGEGDMWLVDILKKDRDTRAAKGLPPPATTRAASAPAQIARPTQTAVAPAAAPATGRRCTPATPYAGAVPASRPPSQALFQQLIANKFTSDATPKYPRRVQFLNFSIGPTVTNTVGRTAQGANRVNNGAPAGVAMTTIKTSFVVCREEYTAKSRYDSTYFCWKSGGEWACGVSESQVSQVK